MSRREAIKFVLVRSLGNFLLLMSIYGVIATFGPALYYEAQYRIIQARGVTFAVQTDSNKNVIPGDSGISQRTNNNVPAGRDSGQARMTEESQNDSAPSFADVLAGSKEQILIPKDTRFSIVIPKIGASAKVFPNVDPVNPDAFLPVLKQGVAHAKGSVFPGLPGNTYLFAHSADNWWDVGRYNAVFYLLKDLKVGDEIVVFFEDQRYEYVVSKTFITEASDVSLLETAHTVDQQQLVLQTCWPPGTTLKRQFVIAVPKQI